MLNSLLANIKVVVLITLLAAFAAPSIYAAQNQMLDDFNDGNVSDWERNNSSDATFSISTVTSPSQSGYALKLNFNLPNAGSWTSAEKYFSAPQNWSNSSGIRLWIYGQGTASNNSVIVQLWESTGERFEKKILVNWSQWKLISIPFTGFVASGWNPPGAAIDGQLNKSSIGTLVLAQNGVVGPSELFFDNIELYSEDLTQAEVMIPLYIYPHTWVNNSKVLNPEWQRLIDVKRQYPSLNVWAIVNPNNGPGAEINQDYVSGITQLKSVGIKVIGYTYTKWAKQYSDSEVPEVRSVDSVQTDIGRWKTWYAVDGIFFDEMATVESTDRIPPCATSDNPTNCTSRSEYYARLNSYAKSQGFTLTVGNPGTTPNDKYFSTMDTIVMYEQIGYPTNDKYSALPTTEPKSKWTILPHTVQTVDVASLNTAKNFVKYIYVTNDCYYEKTQANPEQCACVNPWDNLPSKQYLESLFSVLLNGSLTTNSPPRVSITSPLNGAKLTGSSNITINATASDVDGSVAKVEFLVGNTVVCTDTSAPYSCSYYLSSGTVSLTARATDNVGAVTTSYPQCISATAGSNQSPTVSIANPVNNAVFTAPANVLIQANATDPDGSIQKVEFFQNNTLIGSDTTAPYSVTWSNVPAGSYTLKAVATDNLNASNSSSVLITVNPSSNTGTTTTYHLHRESSTTSGLYQLKTSGPDAARLAITTSDLKEQSTGEKLIKAFNTQSNVPGVSGIIKAGSQATFVLWMRKTANVGTMYPRAKLRLNSSSGSNICTATGSSALTTTLTKYTLTCTNSTDVTMSSTDRFYLWVGVNLTGRNTSTTFRGELDIEGTLNGSYDSQIIVPMPKPSTPTNTTPSSRWIPELNTSWQWQLSGSINLNHNVKMYDIDLFGSSADVVKALHNQGKKVVCYLNAGAWEPYRPDSGSYPESVKGRRMDGFEDERWLDIRQISVLGPIIEKRMDQCKAKGFDAVEPDNIDGYTNNTGFPLTYNDQLKFNKWLADAAHARGLSIALKNDLDQVVDLLPYFDFAINEQCFQYNECDKLRPFINSGKAVFNVEYELPTSGQNGFCKKANEMNFNSMKKNLDLDSYREPCR